VLGHEGYPGLVQEAGRRAFSESSLPPARAVAARLDPEAAAAVVLEGAVIDPAEREGATLEGWPAARGYLMSGSGRPLAAYRVDARDEVHLWLDRRVYRAQLHDLVPLGVDAGRSVLDLVYAAFPTTTVDRQARSVVLEPGPTWEHATLHVLVEDGRGARRAHAEVAMEGAAAHRVLDVWPADLPEGARVVLVLHNPQGVLPAVVEQVIDPRQAPAEAEPSTSAVPRPRAQPPGTRKTDAAPPRRAIEGVPRTAPDDAAPDDAAPDDAAPDDAAPDDAAPERP
jgi:hypothetical protein